MRSLATAFLALNVSDGFSDAAGIGSSRAFSIKTTAKTTTTKPV